MRRDFSSSGQTLFEVLLGMALLAVISALGLGLFIAALKSSRASGEVVQATRLVEEELERARTLSSSSWHIIFNLERSVDYFVIASGTSQQVVPGSEGMLGDDVAQGLLAMWRLDEATTTVAYDATANGNVGTLVGGPVRLGGTACKAAGCLGFDGVDDYARVADSSSTDPSGAITLAAWAKVNVAGTKTIVSKQAATAWVAPFATYNLRFVASSGDCSNSIGVPAGTLIVEFWTNARAGRNVCSDLTLASGVWYHVAATYDGAVKKIYVDGKLAGSLSVSGTISDSPYELAIGSHGTGSNTGDLFAGNLDDVRIYNRALSLSEITGLYQSKVYTRKFTLANVSRNASGDIVASGGTNDPSTQKITVTANWAGGGSGVAISAYLIRARNEVLDQTDWSGGEGVEGPIPATIGYASSSLVVTTSTGELILPPVE